MLRSTVNNWTYRSKQVINTVINTVINIMWKSRELIAYIVKTNDVTKI